MWLSIKWKIIQVKHRMYKRSCLLINVQRVNLNRILISIGDLYKDVNKLTTYALNVYM